MINSQQGIHPLSKPWRKHFKGGQAKLGGWSGGWSGGQNNNYLDGHLHRPGSTLAIEKHELSPSSPKPQLADHLFIKLQHSRAYQSSWYFLSTPFTTKHRKLVTHVPMVLYTWKRGECSGICNNSTYNVYTLA